MIHEDGVIQRLHNAGLLVVPLIWKRSAGLRRSALYNNVKPGQYKFPVQACNADGVWNTAGDAFSIEFPPPFYQTLWFKVLCGPGVILIFFCGHRWEVKRMVARQRRLQLENDLLEAKVSQRTEQLAGANSALRGEIAEREKLHHQLLETSRQAGMAEVATGVLHNVGNVLNSVNVSASVFFDQVKKSKVVNIERIAVMMQEHAADLGGFMTQDPKGKLLPGFIADLAIHLKGEQADALVELSELQKNIEHIKVIVFMQQSYAQVAGVTQTIHAAEWWEVPCT